MSPFYDWLNFYVITGSSSAALTGLVFVVTTIVAGRRDGSVTGEGTSVFSSPTVVHFCAAFFIACVASVPWHRPSVPSAIIGLAGLFGVAMAVQIFFRARNFNNYQPDRSDFVWFTILPGVAYAAEAASGFFLPFVPIQAAFALAAASVALIFIGIHNAWDVINYLAIRRED